MKNILYICFLLSALLLSCEDEQKLTIALTVDIPTESIEEEKVLALVEVIRDGGDPAITRGLCWSTSPDPGIDSEGKYEENVNGTGTFEYEITGLIHNTTYYVRAFGYNSTGLCYSIQSEFKTKRIFMAPAVSDPEVSNVSIKTATVEARVTDDGGKTILARGVCFGESPEPTLDNSARADAAPGSGSYSCSLSGLRGSTTYYVRAFAINEKGTSYSENVTEFKTEYSPISAPNVVTDGSENISLTAATLSGEILDDDGAGELMLRGVLWTDVENEVLTTSTNNKMQDGINKTGKVTYKITGLKPQTTYYYCIFAENAGGVGYGEKKSFATDELGALVLVEKGSFMMGADAGETGYNTTHGTAPKHSVTLTKDYWIGKYEITAMEYAEFLNAIGAVSETRSGSTTIYDAKVPPAIAEHAGKTLYYHHNVVNMQLTNGSWKPGAGYEYLACNAITWIGATLYCEWKSSVTGKKYRLPTEAEWEFAARGGNYSLGYKYCGGDILEEVAVFGTTIENIQAPGSKKPNELGIYDMSGNLWEFVSDKASTTYYETVAGGVTDPLGAITTTTNYVRRGDCFASAELSTQFFFVNSRWATISTSDEEQGRHNGNGFRVVVEP